MFKSTDNKSLLGPEKEHAALKRQIETAKPGKEADPALLKKIESLMQSLIESGSGLRRAQDRESAQAKLDYWSAQLLFLAPTHKLTATLPRIAPYKDRQTPPAGEGPAPSLPFAPAPENAPSLPSDPDRQPDDSDQGEEISAEVLRDSRELIRLSSFARQWRTRGRSRDYLIRGKALQTAIDAGYGRRDPDIASYLDASKAHDQKIRRFKYALSLFGAILLGSALTYASWGKIDAILVHSLNRDEIERVVAKADPADLEAVAGRVAALRKLKDIKSINLFSGRTIEYLDLFYEEIDFPINLTEARLIALQMQGIRRPGAPELKFARASLQDARFLNATLLGAIFDDCQITSTDTAPQGTGYDFTSFKAADARQASFTGCTISNAFFQSTNLEGSHFDNTEIADTSYVEANLRNASFRGADIRDTVFDYADVTGADFEGAIVTIHEPLFAWWTAHWDEEEFERLNTVYPLKQILENVQFAKYRAAQDLEKELDVRRARTLYEQIDITGVAKYDKSLLEDRLVDARNSWAWSKAINGAVYGVSAGGDAENIAREALAMAKTPHSVANTLGYILLQKGRYTEAVTVFQEFLTIDPGQFPPVQTKRTAQGSVVPMDPKWLYYFWAALKGNSDPETADPEATVLVERTICETGQDKLFKPTHERVLLEIPLIVDCR